MHHLKTTFLGRKRYHGLIIILLLAAVVLLLYWPVIGYEFIALDDNLYVVENANVQNGVTFKGLAWAMTTFYATNWHPLTWLTYMSDYEWFGLNPAGYHLASLMLHLVNTIFLFLLLRRMTGELWKSGVVAAFFAIHPLNVESIVWIAERKNLLSTLFMILTILVYVSYVEHPEWKRYSMILVFFCLGLMSKPMLVTLPFVLLLLDYWPLRRFPRTDQDGSLVMHGLAKPGRYPIHLLLEKAPLFFLSWLSAIVTFYAAQTGGAVKASSAFPLLGRLENAIISYTLYLYKMVWPADLAIFYPYPAGHPVWLITLSFVLLSAAMAMVCVNGRKYRYLITGWIWYVITLLPVIGLVQVGFQSMANRYAYIPLIGIFMIIVWGLPDLLARIPGGRYLTVMTGMILIALTFCTKSTLPNWKNSEAVFKQALSVTKNNHVAEIGMGNVWFGRGDLRKAASYYLKALQLKPDYAEAHNNLGLVLMSEGQYDKAEMHFHEAIRNDPTLEKAYDNLRTLRGRL